MSDIIIFHSCIVYRLYGTIREFLQDGRTTRQRIHNPAHKKPAYKTIKTPRPKPEADADHCIPEGAEILVRHI
jgi:hypothetical protein